MHKVVAGFACLAFTLAFITSRGQGSWERITVPTAASLYSVCFTDSVYGWAVGDSGTILHTTDGGNAWALQPCPVTGEIMTVFFLNRNLGWASAFNFTVPPFGTVLLRTTNGGDDWTATPYPQENIFINCILFFDSLTGWMGGMPHALVKTTDGGDTWNQATIDTSIFAFFPVLNITFYDTLTGFACGGMFDIAGVIWRTTNGGDIWYAIDASQAPADEVHALHIIDPQHVIGAGGDPDYGYGVGMIRSSDGGLNWAYEDIGIQGIAFDIDFRTATEAWAPLGPRRKLIWSPDSGESWNEIATPDSVSVLEITFPDSLHGYAVGHDGAVLKYHPPVPPFVPPFPGKLSGDYALNVSPNPGSSLFFITCRVPDTEVITVKLHSLSGIEVARIAEMKVFPGVHQFPFRVEAVPPGIYLVSLSAGGHLKTTRRIIIRTYTPG